MTIENIWRSNVISQAFAMANHIWSPNNNNIYHGYDKDGILINTPDISYNSNKYNCGWWITNQVNKGIPYNWGGACTIEEFNKGIYKGKFAGNVPDSRYNGVSKHCVGVDCSGLITICWSIPKKLSTKSILDIASPLNSTDMLQSGDIILLPGSHVMIFLDFIDQNKNYTTIIDATRSTGKVSSRTVSLLELLKEGYCGYRKDTYED